MSVNESKFSPGRLLLNVKIEWQEKCTSKRNLSHSNRGELWQQKWRCTKCPRRNEERDITAMGLKSTVGWPFLCVTYKRHTSIHCVWPPFWKLLFRTYEEQWPEEQEDFPPRSSGEYCLHSTTELCTIKPPFSSFGRYYEKQDASGWPIIWPPHAHSVIFSIFFAVAYLLKSGWTVMQAPRSK